MEDVGTIILFMVVSFALAIIIILKKDSLPEQIRRPIAIITLVMVCASFIMLIVKLFTLS